MPIINIQTVQTGLVGVLPSLAYIETSDPEATVLTAGYLNHEVQNGASFSLPCIAAISTKETPTSAANVGWYQITKSGVNWSVVPAANPGDVVLPTVATRIAYFTNTTGTISSADGGGISHGGNIAAGYNGSAGALQSFSSTVDTGQLRIQAIANSGNFITHIRNAAHGQDSIYSIPDGGQSTSNFIISNSAGTQTIATGSLALTLGNLTVAAGNIAATLGSVAAGTTVTAGTGITATTGGITASQGNVTAGSSAHAASLISFPASAANGTLIISALNAGGAFNTTIRNSAMGQSTVYSMGDIGAATGGIVVATSAILMKSVAAAAAAGGAAAQSFTDAFCTSGSMVVGCWNTQANAASVLKIVPGNGSFVVTSSADAGVGTFNYIITK
jgi:hypothetical protein